MWKDVAKIWWKLFSCLKLLCFFPTVSSQWLVGTLKHHRVLFYVRRQFASLCHRKGKAWHNAKEHVIVVGAGTINITWTRHIVQWSVVKVGCLLVYLSRHILKWYVITFNCRDLVFGCIYTYSKPQTLSSSQPYRVDVYKWPKNLSPALPSDGWYPNRPF